MTSSVFVHVVLAVELVHAPGVEKYQYDKGINGPLLCKPEAKLIATDTDGIHLFDEQDAKSVRNDKPYDEAYGYKAYIRLPI
jgi:hypothetical protein